MKKKVSKNQPPNSVKKIKLYPNTQQKLILKNWFDTARYTYNICVDGIKNKKCKLTKSSMRNYCLNRNAELLQDKEWVFKTPYDVRDEAMNDLLKAQEYLIENSESYNMKYRSKKDASASIVIHNKHFKNKIFYPTFWKKKDKIIKTKEPLPDLLGYDTRLQRTRLGEYYFCILNCKEPQIQPKKEKCKVDVNKNEGIIALDPGVRTFMTGYDTNNKIFEWGIQDINMIFKIGLRIDKLQSLRDKSPSDEKRKIKKKMYRAHKRIKNLINEMHCKMAKWLCENYKVVLIPEFGVQNMIKRKDRKINSKTVRKMITWSHYSFRQRLITKSLNYPECKVIIVDEGYTTKTCVCGKINSTIAGSKTFKCKKCDYVADRDHHGSFQILVRHLTLRKLKAC